jgi:hypothetical protein
MIALACCVERVRLYPGSKRVNSQVVSHHGGPKIGLEVVEAAPSAAAGAIGALEEEMPASMPARKLRSLR